MNEANMAIKIKDAYIILINPRNAQEVIILDKVKEKIFLKFKINDTLRKYNLNFNKVINHFLTTQALDKSIEGKVINKLYSRYPKLFETRDVSDPGMKQDYIEYEFNSTINLQRLFETYTAPRQNNYKIVIWGINETSMVLVNYLSRINIPVTIVQPSEEEVQEIQFKKFLALNGFESEEQFIEKVSLINNVNFGREPGKDEAMESIHIIDNRLLEFNLINKENFELHTSDHIVMHYGFYTEEFILGPLSLKGESYGYKDFKRQYASSCALPNIPQSLTLAGLIIRVIYFIIKDTLKYAAEDIQLPINQVFSFENDSFNSSIINIEGVV